MLKKIFLVSLIMLSSKSWLQEKQNKFNKENPEWENPQVCEVNREPARASFIPYSTEANAATNDKWQSTYVHSLNGMWKFNLVKKPALKPEDFYKKDFNDSDWKEIPVPSIGSWKATMFQSM